MENASLQYTSITIDTKEYSNMQYQYRIEIADSVLISDRNSFALLIRIKISGSN